MMKEQNIPQDSLIAGYLPADYCDSFSRNVVSEKAITSDEFFDMAFNQDVYKRQTYVSANAELTVDLQSNMANECRAKIGYENLLSFTEDPFVKETLTFLMTREITHFQQFEAALSTIQPNFPPGSLQTSPKYSNLYFNLSKGEDSRGPWNEGESTRLKEEWQYIDDPCLLYTSRCV